MKVRLATMLVRWAVRLLDDDAPRRVILNTHRIRGKAGTPMSGRVVAFLCAEPVDEDLAVLRAFSFVKGTEPETLGMPVPEWVARMAGWKVTRI